MGDIKGVLFDLDGTLIDTYDLILASFRHTVTTVLGRDYPDEVLMQKVGQPLVTQMWDFADTEELHDRLVDVYRAHNETIHDDVVTAFPGVKSTLETLKDAGFKLGVVTSKRTPLAQRALDLLGLAPYLECTVGSVDCEQHKPHPAPVIMGCEKLGLTPQQCIYVGDSPFDIQAGNGAGCITAAALWGMFPRDVLAAEHPHYEICAMEELPLLLGL